MDPAQVIFNRVGFMQYYGAHPEGAEPVAGRASSDEHGQDAGDKSNFKSGPDGRCLGLIHSERINVLRLGAPAREAHRLGVLVVTVGPGPDGTGQYVVGWQPGAHVVRERKKRGTRSYNYSAPAADAVLLPVDKRTWSIPQGPQGMGRPMFAFGQNTDGTVRAWVREVLALIANYDGPNLLTDPNGQAHDLQPAL